VTGFAPCVDFDALSAVDAVEARKVTAEKSGTLTPSGVLADTLQFAASTLAPKLQKAKRAVEQAKSEAAERRAKLVLKPADKTDAAGQMRRLRKLDIHCPTASAMPISPRPVITLIRNCSEEERRRKRQIMHLAQTHQTLISNG
jgi:hypothetical protein